MSQNLFANMHKEEAVYTAKGTEIKNKAIEEIMSSTATAAFEEKLNVMFDVDSSNDEIWQAMLECSAQELQRVAVEASFYRRMAASDAWVMSNMTYNQVMSKAYLREIAFGMIEKELYRK